MDYIADASDLLRKFRTWVYRDAQIPDDLRDRLQTIPGGDAEVITNAPEIMYAHYDQLDDAGKRIMGEIWVHGNEKLWTSFAGGPKGSYNRAEQIVEQVSRDLGDEGAIQPRPLEEWPEPRVGRREDGIDWRLPATAD
jgi:hypothetical protein